jgi:MarR family transcriptional regulator for hemolysin
MEKNRSADALAVQHHLMPLMGQMNRQWRRIIDEQLRPRGLSEAMWLPLLHLARATEAMRQKDLARSLALDSSSVVRLLDGLEQAGLIERAGHVDRRAKTIRLTSAGKAMVRRVETLLAKNRERVFSSIPEQQLNDAFATLQQLASRLDSLEQDMRL